MSVPRLPGRNGDGGHALRHRRRARAMRAISPCAPQAWCRRSTSSPTSPRSARPAMRAASWRRFWPKAGREMRARISGHRRGAGGQPGLSAEDRRLLSPRRPTRLAALLRQGKSVGLLAEGDPFFYGSFMHMWRRLSADFPVEVVPGVTGMSGCWTRANLPMTWGNDALAVLPGTLGESALVERLRLDRRGGDHEGRPQSREGAPRRRGGGPALARRLCRARHDGGRAHPAARRLRRRSGAYFAMVLIPGEGRRL